MSSSRYWCFTENDNPQSFAAALENTFIRADGQIVYICGQLEIASTGQMHFQGYVQFKTSRKLSYARNRISDTAHYEIQRGSNKQARDYCKKVDETTVPDSFVEFGSFVAGKKTKGSRNDIHTLRDRIRRGDNQRSMIEDDTVVEVFANNLRFADRVRSLYPTKRKREDDFKVSLYFGAPRTGKTRKAFDDHPDLFEVPISNGTLWLDGYDDHEVVLWDDFTGAASKMSLDNTLKFLDRYVRKVPIKGAHVWYKPNHIIVTSNFHPRNWYDYTSREEHWEALWKRFTEVIVFNSQGETMDVSVEYFMLDVTLWPDMTVQLIQ